MNFDLSKKMNEERLEEFAGYILGLSKRIGMKISARGWCYVLEGERIINKDQFNKVENWINECRRRGILPVDLVAVQEERVFGGVVSKTVGGVESVVAWMLSDLIDGGRYFNLNWWEDEKYYVQVLVEKVDLVTLFSGECSKCMIPIGNAKGWQSILQRADYARRFKKAEEMGLQPVLLYCGDHDPDGLRISETIRKNLKDVQDVVFESSGGGVYINSGYNPENLIIDRFGLDYDFIKERGLTWIDNLVTGSGGEIARMEGGRVVRGMTKAGKPHPNFDLDYAKEYIERYGVRKCEANALVVDREGARILIKEAIEKYLGEDCWDRFDGKRERAKEEYKLKLEGLNLNLEELKEEMREMGWLAEIARRNDDGNGVFKSIV